MQHDKQTSVFFVPLLQVTIHYIFASFWSRLGLGQLFSLESPHCLEPAQLLTKPWKFRFPCYRNWLPARFGYPDVGARRSSSLFLTSQFIAFPRMQNRELVFI